MEMHMNTSACIWCAFVRGLGLDCHFVPLMTYLSLTTVWFMAVTLVAGIYLHTQAGAKC